MKRMIGHFLPGGIACVRSLVRRVATAALIVAPATAQVLEKDAITVPVEVEGKFDARYYQDGDPANDVIGGGYFWFDSSNYVGTYANTDGWNQFGPTVVNLKPGKDYSVTAGLSYVKHYDLQLSAPPGYRIYIENVRRSRIVVMDSSTYDSPSITLKVRIEVEESVPVGQPASLRPGKIVWSVGMGKLSNGRSAGSISLREPSVTSSVFTPAALIYDTASPEVYKKLDSSGALKQIYATQCLVNVSADSSSAFRLKFYKREQVGAKDSSTELYAVTGDPLFEYLITGSAASGSVYVSITRTVRQGGATLVSATQLNQPASNVATVSDWTTGPLIPTKTWSYSGTTSNSTEITWTAADYEQRVYTPLSWGSELTYVLKGASGGSSTLIPEMQSMGYTAANRMTSTGAAGGQWTKTEYFDDWDKRGLVYRIYKPYLSSPATVADASTTAGEVTTYDYVADWTGRKTLPSSITTAVNGIVSAKTEISYAYEDLTNYQNSAHATLKLVVATKKDYYDNGSGTTHCLTTITKTFREDSDPERRFFAGLPHSVQKPDGTKSVTYYVRVSYNASTRSYTIDSNGSYLLAITVNGTTVSSSESALLGTFSLGDQTPPTESGFRVVPGVSTTQLAVSAPDGTVVYTESQILTGTTSSFSWVTVRRDTHTYTDELFLASTTRDSGSTGTGATWNVVANTWTKGRLDATVDETGLRTEFTYDDNNRVRTKTRKGTGVIPDLVTTFDYDVAGRVLKETVSSPDVTETLVTSRAFDTAGRQTSETKPGYNTAGTSTASAVTTTMAYDPVKRLITITLPSGGTKIEELYLDGRRKSLAGTAVVAEFSTYGIETDGRHYTRVNLATSGDDRKKETWTDMLGRDVKTKLPPLTGSSSDVCEETSIYDDYNGSNTGRLSKTTKTGYAATLYQYNAMSQVVCSGLDLDDGGSLVATSSDRVADASEVFEFFSSAWWLKKTVTVYPQAGTNAGTGTVASITRQRLTGLTASLRAETRATDADGNTTTVTTEVDSANCLVTKTTTRQGTASAQVEKAVNGQTVSVTGHDGLITSKSYDALGRPNIVTDPRAGPVTTTYHTATVWPKEVIDGAGKHVSLTHYDVAGRVIYTEDAYHKTTRTAYSLRGEVAYVWGSSTYPVSYVYSDYGERTKLRTYRDPGNLFTADATTWPGTSATFDETTWEFFPGSGLLKKKIDAAGKFVEYDYNVRGQTAHRYWARTLPSSTTRVTTTYAYYGDGSGEAKTGDLKSVTYNDGTLPVKYTYTRLGQIDTVADATSSDVTNTVPTDLRDFAYDSTDPTRLASEGLTGFYSQRVLSHTWETSAASSVAYAGHTLAAVPGRANGWQLGSSSAPAGDLDLAYAFDNLGRVAGLVSRRANTASTARQFVYAYETNSPLLKSLSVVNDPLGTPASNPFTITREFEAHRDLITSVETKWGSGSANSVAKFVYTYDDAGRRQSVVQSGNAYADYGDAIHQIFDYTDRSELKSAPTFLGSSATSQSAPLSARQHAFGYDAIGNRRSANSSGSAELADGYWSNSLNQITARENNTLAVGGTADASTKVAVGVGALALAGRGGGGKHWGDNVALDNLGGPFFGDLKVFAASTSGTGAIRTETRTAFLPPAYQTFTYDNDGNLLTDGVWKYTWDAENRLVAVETDPSAIGPIPSSEARRLEFKYDYLHRRVEKLVRNGWNGTGYSSTPLAQTRYLYDGWSVIAEFSVSGSTLTLIRSYTWGLDIARSFADAGGVGALLQVHDQSLNKDYLPGYDANGNIAVLLDAAVSSETEIAIYEYSPYGELLRCEGSYAKSNPYRFSTKTIDDETGLVYYGRRYYNPSHGCFLGRDTKNEKGGLNLYAFCLNNPINRWDVLGMEPMQPQGVPQNRSDTREVVIRINPDGSQLIQAYKSDPTMTAWEEDGEPFVRLSPFTSSDSKPQSPTTPSVSLPDYSITIELPPIVGPATVIDLPSASATDDSKKPKPNSRKFTAGEIALAKSLFGSEIDTSKPEIFHQKWAFFQPSNVVMTPDGNMYFNPAGNDYRNDFSTDADINIRALFVHELVHIWQYQHGVNVVAQGLFSIGQYNYLPLQPGKKFTDYNIEQQGDILMDYYYLKQGSKVPGLATIEEYEALIPFLPKN